MKTQTTSIAGQISASRALIDNSLANSRVLALVSARGYDVDTLAAGRALLDTALRAIGAQAAAAGASQLATEHAHTSSRRARSAYRSLVGVVRAIYPANSPQLRSLDVVGPEPSRTAAFISGATTLYGNALSIPEIGAELARYGYDAKTLTVERGLVDAYQEAVQAKAQAQSAAVEATRNKRLALRALRVWVAQYAKIARVVLRAEPELLIALGLAPRGALPRAPRTGNRAAAPPETVGAA